jgi:hypothetical protein
MRERERGENERGRESIERQTKKEERRGRLGIDRKGNREKDE